MQQHRVNRRKNCGVRTDRQCERQDRDEAEAGAFKKLTERELKIM
jgi:hypothetical protein